MELIVEVLYKINIGKMFSTMLAPSAPEINAINIILTKCSEFRIPKVIGYETSSKLLNVSKLQFPCV